MAVTDHDSTEGLAAAIQVALSFPQLTMIPGVELGTDIPRGEIHILGLFIQYGDSSFQATLANLRDSRVHRARRMVEKLAAMGMPLDWSRVLELADGAAVGRPHVARALLEKGYVQTQKEAFDKYIGRNGPAYAERAKLTPEDAIALVRRVGGLPILCHPAELEDLETHLAHLVGAGLVGVEVYYGGYSQETVSYLDRLAQKYGLVPCGGSDYHAVGNPDESLPGDAGPSIEVAERLFQMANTDGRRLVVNAPWR